MSKFIVSYSGGKDSTLALDRMINDGHELCGIFTTTNQEIGSWFHDIKLNILQEIAKSIETTFFPMVVGGGSDYTKDFEQALIQLHKETGADTVVFGDIDIEDHRIWCTQRCDNVGMKAVFPLWNEGRVNLVNEFIDKEYTAIIKKVDKSKLSKDFLNKKLTHELINEFTKLGIDECGENGEYHTVVVDGPIFKNPINVVSEGVEETEYSYNLKMSLK